ncbi:MAG TPA: cellulase family glycosylhydrolase [Solirubrobacterales bacterium]|nr:cellulase family glycosylhydrolase [Solirubrobacterales bacterium]
MRRERARRWLPAALLAVLAALPVTSAHAAPVEPLGASGRWITDAEGRVIVLHGANVVAKGAPYLPSDAGFGTDDAEYLVSEGFNTIRYGVDYAAIEPTPDGYDTAFLQALAAEAEAVGRSGLFVLADVHQDMYTERFQGNGLPDWMAIDDGQPNAPLTGFPGNYFSNTALLRSYDNFWANADGPDGDPLQEHYAEGLRRLAVALAGNEGLLGYDLFNEPWAGSPWPGCFPPGGCAGPGEFDATLLSDFTDRAVAGIRQGDPTHLAFYEPNLIFNFGAPTGHRDPADPRTAFSFHDYCQASALGGDESGCPPEEQKVFDNAEAHSAATGSPPLMTEFGATESAATMDRLADMADRNMVGWQYWTYSNVFDGDSVLGQSLIKDLDLPPTPDNIKQPAMDALARPYPQVVAGAPTSWSWDEAAKVFELGYSTTGPSGKSFADGGETEVFVPARHFPGGYAVAATGAEVVSAPDARVVRLRSCPGAKEVSVSLGTPALAPPPGSAIGGTCGSRCGVTKRVAKGQKGWLLRGTPAGDRLLGDAGRDRIVAGRGDDCLDGKRGDDRLLGGPGDDRLKGGPGRDRLKCGKGRDLALVGRGDSVHASCEKVRRGKK